MYLFVQYCLNISFTQWISFKSNFASVHYVVCSCNWCCSFVNGNCPAKLVTYNNIWDVNNYCCYYYYYIIIISSSSSSSSSGGCGGGGGGDGSPWYPKEIFSLSIAIQRTNFIFQSETHLQRTEPLEISQVFTEQFTKQCCGFTF